MRKQTIKDIVGEAIREALTVEVTYEQRRDIETGKPMATPKLRVENEYLPLWWVRFLPHYEASNRGIQETQDKQSNSMNRLDRDITQLRDKVDAIGNIIINAENSLKCIATLSDHIKQLDLPDKEVILIESSD